MTDLEQRIFYLEQLIAKLDQAIQNLKLQLQTVSNAQRQMGYGGGGGSDPLAGASYFSAVIDNDLGAGMNLQGQTVWTLRDGRYNVTENGTIINDSQNPITANTQVFLGRGADGTFGVTGVACQPTTTLFNQPAGL